jgi:GNAT superfamily N-acetyltransferase
MTTVEPSPLSDITITTVGAEQLPAVVDLLIAQEVRQWARDPRLRTAHSHELVAASLARSCEQSLVALDARGRVRGYARPSVWQLAETSMMRAFLSARNGVAQQLILPDPEDEDAQAVLAALLAALSLWWKDQGTTGDLVRWPSADAWVEPSLAAQGLRLDSVCAARGSDVPARRSPPPGIVTRQAWPADEQALLKLFEEELQYHERYTPFVRRSPAVLTAFRRKLARRWAGASLEDGAPLVLVAEREGVIVGMAETTLLNIGPDDEPGFTPPGRYGCLDNVCVREAWRGQSIGQLLVQTVEDMFVALPLDLDGWLLWYNPDNPQAAHFWPRRGFVPLWTTYQRLHPSLDG